MNDLERELKQTLAHYAADVDTTEDMLRDAGRPRIRPKRRLAPALAALVVLVAAVAVTATSLPRRANNPSARPPGAARSTPSSAGATTGLPSLCGSSIVHAVVGTKIVPLASCAGLVGLTVAAHVELRSGDALRIAGLPPGSRLYTTEQTGVIAIHGVTVHAYYGGDVTVRLRNADICISPDGPRPATCPLIFITVVAG